MCMFGKQFYVDDGVRGFRYDLMESHVAFRSVLMCVVLWMRR